MRLKPHLFQMLLALSDQDRHGNGIVRRVLEISAGATRLWPVTLHRALDELQDGGLIAELAGAEHPDGKSRRRVYYRLTPAGADALRAEAGRLDELARLARRNLAGRDA